MLDQSQRPAELGYAVMDLMLHYNDAIMQSATARVNLDDFVHAIYGYATAFDNEDPTFTKEWLSIQRAREEYQALDPDYVPGADGYESHDRAYRAQEWNACIRSLYRRGVISKIQTNKTTWNPNPPVAYGEIHA